MSALKSLTDAGGLTKRYFAALGAVGWLKLAFVVLFIGGLGISNQVFSLPVDSGTFSDPGEQAAALGVAAAGVGVYAGFRYFAALLEFVFVESLRSQALSVRLYLRSNLGAGLRLMVFRWGLWLAALAVVAVPVGWTVLVGNVTDPVDVTAVQAAGIGLTALVALLGLTTVTTLTNAFVVPIMVHERRGVLSGWRRFLDAMASNKTGVVAFLLIAWLIGFALWVALTVVGFVVGVVGLFGLVLAGAAATQISSAFEPLVVVGIIGSFFAYQYVVSTVVAPIRSYVRYYGLVILGNTEPRLDLVPAQRAAMGADEDAADTDAVDAAAPAAAVDPADASEPVDGDQVDSTDPVDTDDSRTTGDTDEER